MTTLLISANFPPLTGGSGRWFWDLYTRLPRGRYLVAAGEHPRQDEIDRLERVPTVRLPLALPDWSVKSPRGFWGYARAVKRLRTVVRAEKVRMIHCGRTFPEGVMALALRWLCGIPFACYVHGEELTTAATSREFTFLVRRVMAAAQFLVANSQNTKALLLRDWKVPEERVHVLYPGVDTTRYVPAAADSSVRTALGWGSRPVVLTVGRLQKRKGHDTVIRALPALRSRFPALLYAIAGDGEERAPLESLARELGVSDSVQFLGEINDDVLLSCYQQCDLFVLANRRVGDDFEGFGIVLLEAQACARPVVAGDSGGTSETMNAPHTGRVVNCDGPEALSATIGELLADAELRERMGQTGRRWVVEQFDWVALTRKAERLFDETVIDFLPRK